MPPWLLHCDGTATPNPGRLGIGAVVVDDGGDGIDGRRIEISRDLQRFGDNNEAEIEAVIATANAERHG